MSGFQSGAHNPPESASKRDASSGSFIVSKFPTRERITQRAYEIYVRNGCRSGESETNWMQAQRELFSEAVQAMNEAHAIAEAKEATDEEPPLAVATFRPARLMFGGSGEVRAAYR